MAQAGRDRANAERRDKSVPRAPRRRSVASAVLLVVALVLFLDGIAGERGWLANRRAAAQYRAAEQALKDAKARNAALREEVRRLEHDPATIEEAARRQLGLMKPGEKLFIVREQTQDKK